MANLNHGARQKYFHNHKTEFSVKTSHLSFARGRGGGGGGGNKGNSTHNIHTFLTAASIKN